MIRKEVTKKERDITIPPTAVELADVLLLLGLPGLGDKVAKAHITIRRLAYQVDYLNSKVRSLENKLLKREDDA